MCRDIVCDYRLYSYMCLCALFVFCFLPYSGAVYIVITIREQSGPSVHVYFSPFSNAIVTQMKASSGGVSNWSEELSLSDDIEKRQLKHNYYNFQAYYFDEISFSL